MSLPKLAGRKGADEDQPPQVVGTLMLALLAAHITALQAAFGAHAERPLDHIPAGRGRDGQPFMSWTWEVAPLP